MVCYWLNVMKDKWSWSSKVWWLVRQQLKTLRLVPALSCQGVTLTLSDMRVTERRHNSWTPPEKTLYSIYTAGLYIVISVPSRGITLIWDRHTRVTIELTSYWKASDEDFEIFLFIYMNWNPYFVQLLNVLNVDLRHYVLDLIQIQPTSLVSEKTLTLYLSIDHHR